MKLVQKTKKDGKDYMTKNKSKRKQLTYHQMETMLHEMADALGQIIHRVNNLEYGIFSYIEFRKTGKRFNKWMDKRNEEAQKKEGVKNAVHKNETTNRENLEASTTN